MPEVVRRADLTDLPALRVLEERTIRHPWRLDRRYTLVERYPVFNYEQLYERRRPGQRKVWELMRADLRQVVDVVGWAKGERLDDHSVIRLGWD